MINFLERMVLNSFRAMVGGRCAPPPSFGGIGLSSLNSSLEIIGAIMGRTVILDKLIEPIGFFSSSEALRKEQGWTSLNMVNKMKACLK